MSNSISKPRLAAMKRHFKRDGFLLLPGLFDDGTIGAAQASIDRVKRERPLDVVIDNLDRGGRTVLGLVSPETIARDRMKINDLYLRETAIRELALAPSLAPILRALLGHVPALCNSLYLEKGSAQEDHVDSLYMTPRTPYHLIASWIALEDSHPDAGELEYWPGSHEIPPMVFGNGGHHVVEAEMEDWRAYIAGEVQGRGLERRRFAAKRGDVFIWHTQLLHAGGVIRNPALTRKSCVFHYYSESDAAAAGQALEPMADAFWINRAPQPLPPEIASQSPFSEAAYLDRYPDVAAAVRSGAFASGRAHYDLYGRAEGRLPR